MLYGSGGFNSFGYQGGCAFSDGRFDEAIQSPAAARYLCQPQESTTNDLFCFHDASGSGQCRGSSFENGFLRLSEVRSAVPGHPYSAAVSSLEAKR